MGFRTLLRSDTKNELEKRIIDSEKRGMKLLDKGSTRTEPTKVIHWARMERVQ